ncbi:hypothetical protein QJS10_CPB13g01076 [Acorus calamus]|uniref:Reverse transcriptase domain-containing protein n=1 Tax=Acorus calamus TaxID=4465 RepID=A0AAV9DHE6_ACOCL|nr:hypothetical protein QJS10_CPB13g01076 [Acorus calamus]
MGDFNVTRFVKDRNRQGSISQAMVDFSDWIDSESWVDIPLANQCFTWSSLREVPSCARLDRVLVSPDWEDFYPLCSLRGLPRICSDHTPLLLEGGAQSVLVRWFKFENWWLQVDGFRELVDSSWRMPALGLRGAKKFSFKLKRLKRTLKGWNAEQRKLRREKKEELAVETKSLDDKEETGPLLEEERNQRCAIKVEWNRLLSMEEAEWRQRSRETWLKEGDGNTKFFHKVASQRRRANKILKMQFGEVVTEHLPDIEQGLVDHFKEAYQRRRAWAPDWVDEDLGRVPNDQWQFIDSPFSESEVQKVVFGLDADSAPGPDGFGARFIQSFWQLIKEDVMEMFQFFFSGQQSIGCLNATFLVLIPKKEGALEVGDYRPISLVNGSYKRIAKALANRMKKVIGGMVEENQTAFIPGKLLQDGFMATQECISATYRDNRKGIVIKLDFAKAYDNVNWEFLLKVLRLHGFEANWLRMIEECIASAKVLVLVNSKPCGFFHINKGLRQGDPLSPLLFVVVTNVFSRMMKMAENEGWINGLRCSPGGSSISHVQYADDTIILCEAEEDSIRGVQLICRVFELLSGLRINFHKSAMLGIHVDRADLIYFAQIFQCSVMEFPVRHLGLPLHLGNFLKAEWSPLIEKFTQWLEGWKGKLLSSGGRLVLLQAVLSNLPTYFLSLFKIPKGILQKIDGIRRRFLWSGPSLDRRKVHLVKWEIVCSSKREGSLGVLNLEDMNKALLSKWKWRRLTCDTLMWKRAVEERYRCSSFHIDGFPRGAPRPSKIWNGILSATACFMEAVGWDVGNGRAIRFWHDQWVGDTPLKSKFPEIFTIAADKDGLVEQFWTLDSEGGWVIGLQRAPEDGEVEFLDALTRELQGKKVVPDCPDRAVWRPQPKK